MNLIPRRLATFAALQDRHFRWYWLGRLTSLAAFQMDGVAQGWLVYELTGSALSLGWVSASRSITLLLFSMCLKTRGLAARLGVPRGSCSSGAHV